jgi:hypothetical protein
LPQRAASGALEERMDRRMAKGQKTGGRQKGTPNKAKVQLDAKLAEAAERADCWSITFGNRYHYAGGRHALRNAA